MDVTQPPQPNPPKAVNGVDPDTGLAIVFNKNP